jgi:hypothetical protein
VASRNGGNRARRETIRARSTHAAGTRPHTSSVPSPRLFYLGGGLLALAGVASLVCLYLVGLDGGEYTGLIATVEETSSYIAMPGIFFLLAGVLLFLAEMFRRARWSARDRGFWRGGSVAIDMGVTPLPIVLLWLLVPVIAYLLLVPVPVLAETGAGGPGDAVRSATPHFWTLVSCYGFLAAGTVGVFLASLLKRATYRRLAAAHDMGQRRGSTFWRLVATQWRAETFLSFIGFGLLGVLPLLWHDALAGRKDFDDTALVVLLGIFVGCTALAIVTVLNAWRSGDPYGLAESVA